MTRFLCLALTLLALPMAGCGGSKDPENSSSSGEPGYDTLLKFSQCMRSHGLANFPDPVPGERRHLAQLEEGQRPRSELTAVQGGRGGVPQVRTPARHRQADPRGGAAAVPALLPVHAHARRAAVPDPKFSGGGVQLRMPPGLGPDSPSVKAAQQACKSLAPGGMAGKGGNSKGGD